MGRGVAALLLSRRGCGACDGQGGRPMSLAFDQADPVSDREHLLRFNVDYLSWISDAVEARFGISLAEQLGMPIPDYVAGALGKLCEKRPPEGVFYMVRSDGRVVGMGGLRPVRPGVAEMKRVYVPPEERGGGFGARIVERLIEDARGFGYASLWLDTGPFMTSAHRLYEAAGFEDIPAYPEAEPPQAVHPVWRFMGLTLR